MKRVLLYATMMALLLCTVPELRAERPASELDASPALGREERLLVGAGVMAGLSILVLGLGVYKLHKLSQESEIGWFMYPDASRSPALELRVSFAATAAGAPPVPALAISAPF